MLRSQRLSARMRVACVLREHGTANAGPECQYNVACLMSEESDKESKTEEPTEKKIRDAVEKGQLPVSKELPILLSILAFFIYFAFTGRESIAGFSVFLGTILDSAHAEPLDSSIDATAILRKVMIQVGLFLTPLFAILMAGGLAASFMQNMPRFVGNRITPKLSKISLPKGWKRVFGVQGFAEFLKSTSKLCFAALFVFLSLRAAPQSLLEGMYQHTTTFTGVIAGVVMDLLLAICLAMALVAAADLLWTRYHWRQELRMTKQEVKDEMKQSEGDPIVKARLRSVARDRSRQRMMDSVPTATLVVANPTHYSIALRYDQAVDTAPVVVAKGQDLIALRIREIAEAHDVPVFEDVLLARSMYKSVQVDQAIPPQFFQAVAELVKILYAQKAPSRLH